MVAKFTSRVAPAFLTASTGAADMSAASLDVSGAIQRAGVAAQRVSGVSIAKGGRSNIKQA
jgi:hypothetical protein